MLKARDVKTISDAKRIVEERQLSHVKVGVFDIDGVFLGKYMRREKFIAALEHGFSFCNVILGWDLKDKLYDNVQYTGWHTGYPDAEVRIIPSSCRDLYFEDCLLFIGEFVGAAETICPRAVLRRVIQRAEDMGFVALGALEYEFFIFDETPDSVRQKGYRNLKPLTPDNFGYSIIRNSVHAEFHHQILEMGERMDFPIEGLHTETGPGVFEAAIQYDTVEHAADKAALFKTFMKILAQRNNKIATFMAKWSPNCPGQSGHIHLSLKYKEDGRSAFYDSNQHYNMSKIQRHFLAGQQRLMPEFLSLISPTINSYTRLIPGAWAPTVASWGVENRTTALRLIPGNEKSQRIEYRLGSADANPYFALAAAIGAGLYGIEHQLEPEAEVKGNSYVQEHNNELTLPTTLWDAAQNLKKSEAARELFGSDFVTHYAASREWEEREFRKHITDWELDRYFEII
jgi:glutamine synthetase